MQREKIERNNEVIKLIKKGEHYQVDIAILFNISPAMVSKIKKRYLQKNKGRLRVKRKI